MALAITPRINLEANTEGFNTLAHTAFPTVIKEQSTFSFELEQEANVLISIINLNGQIVKQQSFDVPAGKQNITLNDLGNLEPGIFQYHIAANGKKLSGTLIKAE